MLSERIARQVGWLAALAAAWVLCVTLSVAASGSGFLHPETYSFLPHYLSGRPLLTLIYDNQVTDWDNYQARELSFVFDWFDAHFVAASWQRGLPHFFSASHFILLLIAGLALWRIASRHLRLPATISFALVLLLWTCPSALLYSSFYRSAKVALLCASLLAIWAWFAGRTRDSNPFVAAARFGLASLLMPMCDKLGLLFLGGAVIFLGHRFFIRRQDRDRLLLFTGLAALAIAFAYQAWIGPGITQHLFGYAVKKGHIALSASMLTDVRLLATVAGGAPLFAADSLRILIGHLPLALTLLVFGWTCWRLAPGTSLGWLRQDGVLLGGLAIFIAGTFAAMLLVFPMMFSNEHRRFYYPLPSAGLWLVAIAAALARLSASRPPAFNRNAAIVLFALVLSNCFALQEHRFLFRHGKYQPYVENAARVKAALLGHDSDAAAITPAQAATLLPAAPYFRDAVPPSLVEDRIFLCLRARGVQPR